MMPLPGRHLTSVLLRREGELFLFDCGESTQVSLKRLNLKWKKISTIFISHTHADHVTGLPGLLMLSAQVEREEPLVIIGPPIIKEYVETNRKVLNMYINYDIEIREIADPSVPQVVMETDEFVVRSFPLYHSRVCVGYTMEEKPRPGEFFPDKARQLEVPVGPLWAELQRGDSVELADGRVIESHQVMGDPRPGRKFSFVTDTAYNPKISQEVADSDLLICEAMFDQSLADSAKEKRHLTAHQAGTIGRDSNSLKMGLIHYSPRYAEKELEVLRKEAAKLFPETILCRDRMKLPIPHREM